MIARSPLVALRIAPLALLPLALFALSCSAHSRRLHPGTGDVAFRLSWAGPSDLDLMVRDPSGECISYFGKQAPSGGVLDVDCNGSYESTCERPIENIFWPKATAPAGEYTVWVQAHSIVPGGSAILLHLQLLHGRQTFWSQDGVLASNEGVFGPFLYRFPGDGGAKPFPGPVYPPPCGVFQMPAGPEVGD